jgi:hypothetical protein
MEVPMKILRVFFAFTLAATLALTTGCSLKSNRQLEGLLPAETGYKWIYFGFAEYGHEMTLNDIIKDSRQTVYKITGEVFDMSDGEAQGDFGIDLEYIIKNGTLVMNKKSEKMMDWEFDSMILIKTPLEKGNTWKQKLISRDKQEMVLNCVITDIADDNGVKTYTVLYEHVDSSYYEERKIREGVGVTSMNRLYVSQDMSFEIGYQILEYVME